MRHCSRAAACALAALPWILSGCGAAPAANTAGTTTTITPPPTVTSAPVDGRWSVSPFVTAALGSGILPPVSGAQFQGVLSTNGSQVTGAGQVSVVAEPGSPNFACVKPPQNVLLHGTLNAARHLSLVSDPTSDGGVLQIEIDVPSDPHQQSTGTTTLTARCVTVTSNARGLLYEPISGSFNGSVAGIDPGTLKQVTLGTADAVLSEAAPDATGQSVVSGDLTLHFSSCNTHIAVNEIRIGSSAGSGGIPGTALPLPIALVLDSPDGTRLTGPVSGLGQNCQPVVLVPPFAASQMFVTMTKQ